MNDRPHAPGAPELAPARTDPRVVFVEPRLYEDGGARATLALVQAWVRTQVPVVLFVLQRAKPDNAAPVPPGTEITYPARHDRRLRRVLPVALARALPLVRGADVVVSSRELGWGLLLGRVASWLGRRPFVVIIRAAPQEAMRRWVSPRLHGVTRRAYRSADQVVCITDGLVPAVLQLGVRPERVSVVLDGMDVEHIRAQGRAPAADLPAGEGPLVVGIGRLEAQKGFDVLIRAHARVVAAGQPHRLLILGEGRDRAELEQLATDLGVAGSVFLPGFRADLLPVLAAADLYCLSSRYEGFGLSLAEAVVLGVPSIAADCVSGPRFLLADGKHGDLVPVGDVDALAAAVSRHLRDPQRLREAARRGQAWAVQHLRIERAAAELLDVLRDVTGLAAPTTAGAGDSIRADALASTGGRVRVP